MANLKSHPARLAALEQKLHRYDTGEPCKVGHVGPRYVSTCQCCECERINSRKRYAAANPGKPRAEYRRGAESEAFKNSAETRRKHLAAARELRKSFEIEEVSPLPDGASRALSGYTESAIGRRNSEYLNSLITNMHAPRVESKPEPVVDVQPRRIVKNGTSEGRYRMKPRSKVTPW